MTLSAADVRSKQFTTVRFREGYRLEEVDAFLDEIEAELTRLESVIAQLRAVPAALPAPAHPAPPALRMLPAPTGAVVLAAAADPPAQATGILSNAQRAADERIAQAEAQAQQIIGAATAAAAQATVDAAAQRSALEERIAELRTFEREYRSRLRAYIEGQLGELDDPGETSGAVSSAVTAPLPAVGRTPSLPGAGAPAVQPRAAVSAPPAAPEPASPYSGSVDSAPQSPPRQA